MKKVFKWLLAVVVILAAATVVVLYNPNLVRGPLERRISEASGYHVSLAGDLEISIGRSTAVSLADVHVAAPQWSAHNQLVTIDQLFLSLETPSLFDETIVVDSLQIRGLQANLETNSDGENNWQPTKQQATGESIASKDVIFLDVRLDDLMLKHLDQTDEKPQVFYIQTLGQQHRSDDMLDIAFNGSLNDRPVDFDGAIGPFKNLLAGRDISYDGQGNFGNLEIRAKGLIDDLAQPRRPQFELQIQGQNIDEITAMLGIDDLGSGNFSFNATGGEVQGHYEASVNGEIGYLSLHAFVQATDLASLDELDVELAANGPNLGAVTRALGMEDWPDLPFSIDGTAKRVGNTLNIPRLKLDIGGTELLLDALLSDFPGLDSSRVKLGVRGDDIAQFRQLLDIKGLASGPFEVRGRLDVSPQQVELIQVDVQTDLGQMTLSGTLGKAPRYTGSLLHLHLAGHDAHRLMTAFGLDILPSEPYSLDTHLEIIDGGLEFEKGVLVTISDQRLELNGLVSFAPGFTGTDVELNINGQHLGTLLGSFIGGLKFADLPYDLAGRIAVLEEGLKLGGVTARFADIELQVDGLVDFREGFNHDFDFKWRGGDITAIGDFAGLSSSMGAFVPGQPYHATGLFSIREHGWKLEDIKGRIGDTDVVFSGLVSNQPHFKDTQFQFSLEGPDLRSFLVGRHWSDRSIEDFKASAGVVFHGDALDITDLHVESAGLQGTLDLELGLPVSAGMDLDFDIDLTGEDIRHLIPVNRWLEPKHAEYRIKAAGHKTASLLSFQHFDMNIGALVLSIQGEIAETPSETNSHIVFSSMTGDLSSLGSVNGKQLPALPMDFTGKIDGYTRQFALRDFHGTIGQSDITGTLDADLRGTKPEIKLQAQSNLIDLNPFWASDYTDVDVDTEPDMDVDTEPDTQGGRVIPAIPLPLAMLDVANTGFQLNIDEFRLPLGTAFDIVLEGETSNGALDVPRLSWSGVQGGNTSGSLMVKPRETGAAEVDMALNAEHAVFKYTGLTGGQSWLTPEVDIQFHVWGNGNNLQELAGSLNGRFFIGTQGGTLKDVNLSLLDTLILEEIFDLMKSKSAENDDDLTLTCAAAAFDISDGLVKTDPAWALTTDKIRLIGKGKLDLNTEALQFNFNATPRNVLNISPSELINPYIQVGGTLAKPRVGIDPAKALIHGGAAIGTAGISILAKGVLDRVGTTIPTCKKMLEQSKSR